MPTYKTKSQHVKDKPRNSFDSILDPDPDPPLPDPIPDSTPSHINPQKGFKQFILSQPSIIDHPIGSLYFPEIFTQTYAPPIYQTDILTHPMNAQTFSVFMAGQLASDRNRPCYDASAVENTLGFIFYLIMHFLHKRPHSCSTEVEGRQALLTEINIVMRTLFSIKEDPNYKLVLLIQLSSA